MANNTTAAPKKSAASSTPSLSASNVERVVDARVGVLADQIAHEAASGVHEVVVSGEVHTVPPEEPLRYKPEAWTAGATLVLALFTALLALYTRTLAKATFKVVKSDEETARAELRAYVGIVGVNVALSRSEHLTVTIQLQNFGKTPAHHMRNFFTLELVQSGSSSVAVVPNKLATRGSLSPGQSLLFASTLEQPRDAVLQGIRDGRVVLRGVGVAHYADIYGSAHETPIKVSAVATKDGGIAMEYQPDQEPMT